MNLISLGGPSFNESKNLKILCNKLLKIIKQNSKVEVILVNNGSTDDTIKVIRNHPIFKNKKFKLKNLNKNLGYGHGILMGIKISSGKIIAWFHADLQINPNDVLKAILKYKHELLYEKVIVKGKRVNRTIFDRLFTFFMAKLVNLIFDTNLEDINAQPKIFNKKFVEKFKNPPYDFSLDLYLLVLSTHFKYKIKKFPINWGQRFAGTAKGGGNLLGKIKLTYRSLKYILKLKINGNNYS